jgi:hypothetical protein
MNFEKTNNAKNGAGPVKCTSMEKEFLQVARNSRHSILLK